MARNAEANPSPDRCGLQANPKYNEEGSNRLRDGGGLFLELLPSGAKKWRMKYKRPGTRQENLLTFGDYLPNSRGVSLAEAREKRAEAKKLLAAGLIRPCTATWSGRRPKSPP
jgi:hypothetical protein